MKKSILSLIMFVLLVQFAYTQEPITHNLYTVNPFLINPAATGSEKALTAFIDAYNQWTSFTGAPRINTLGVHSPFNKNMSLGFNLYQDKRNYLNHLNAIINYSYRLDLSEKSDLSLGIGLGIVNNTINFSGIYVPDPTDPVYIDAQGYNKSSVAASTGLIYRYKTLQLHFSLPQMLEQGKNFAAQYNIAGFYDYTLSDKWNIKPTAMLRAFPGNVMQFDGNVMAEYKKFVWGQVGYRTDKSLIASIGVNIKGYKVAYAYQEQMGDVSNFATSTHEIMLSYTLPKRVKKEKEVVVVPVKETITIVTNMVDKKYQTPVAGKMILKQGGNIVYSGKANANGLCKIEANPGIYSIEIKATGYLPITEELDLSNIAKGTEYKYELSPEKLEIGLVFKFAGVRFETGKDVLLPESKVILDLAAEIFTDYTKMLIEVAGHTDDVGNDANNLDLSQRRANSVVAYLVSKGVKETQLKPMGYGETKPIVANDTPENRAINRRVEFTILDM